MENKDLYNYISSFNDFSPVIMRIEKEIVDYEFVFMSSEKHADVIEVENKHKEENFYF
jgi:hypothetical protein